LSQFKGIISAGNPQTVHAGAEVLKLGGNAIDAAVAATFASFVAEMALVNINGGGIAALHLAKSGQNLVHDFFCDMPTGPYNPHQSDFKKILVDFGVAQQPFYIGRASSAVPGNVAGLCALAADHGTLPLPVLLAPAIQLARNGVVVSQAMGYVTQLLADIFMDTSASASIYAPQGKIVQAGDLLHNFQLAHTLQQLGKFGAGYVYHGEIANKIAADQTIHGGLITKTDLAQYRVRRLKPIIVSYRNYTVLLPPPSSVGGVLIAFTLKLLATFDVPSMSLSGVERYRLLAEVFRLTNAARQDLQLTENGVARFLSQPHINRKRRLLANLLNGTELPPREPVSTKGPNETTHISVIDADGNVASITTSAGEGAGYVVADTGMAMNNILGEIDLHPNGFHSAEPGKRLQTMMSPTIVLKDDTPVMVLGSGGSTRLRSAIVQVLSNVVDFKLSLAEAVSAPRLHFEEDVLQLEGGMPPTISAALTRLGYQVNRWPDKNMYFGGVHSAGLVGGIWEAVGDVRRGGFALRVNGENVGA